MISWIALEYRARLAAESSPHDALPCWHETYCMGSSAASLCSARHTHSKELSLLCVCVCDYTMRSRPIRVLHIHHVTMIKKNEQNLPRSQTPHQHHCRWSQWIHKPYQSLNKNKTQGTTWFKVRHGKGVRFAILEYNTVSMHAKSNANLSHHIDDKAQKTAKEKLTVHLKPKNIRSFIVWTT